jgi:hypothetical protein
MVDNAQLCNLKTCAKVRYALNRGEVLYQIWWYVTVRMYEHESIAVLHRPRYV